MSADLADLDLEKLAQRAAMGASMEWVHEGAMSNDTGRGGEP